ncbi:ABC transporter ATP-binding protein [Porifericola rhodea]|uniref:ABC transporter ATP-binding protein n=1 Tax=Porifericola rhodea TaxID=930972 RepID=UPI0026671DAF|nr:ABC transporter ATP-binding protein [Porifericola rhodea]WKN29781.1 ABC transporter ATP-binding protein [Porifericola rhodea]
MSEVAIRVENLGKKYHLGGKKSGSFRESVSNLFKKSKPKATEVEHEFWALKDINFEIKRGEAVGIIGRNGAGKSTLLKILSRITEPTKGRFEVFGRVSSLLEVGTGFHPELTGRENVYLNGTILGMKRHEVKAKFDEIVAFSGVEKFIDTPVKHYSSGMQVRLAFAVAAHLEPEILIIDEVLAVGDAEFQKKCLGKMEDVTGEGRTVLFVSHNMDAVRKLCTRGVLFQQGTIAEASYTVNDIIKSYLMISPEHMNSIWENNNHEFSNEYFDVVSFGIYHANFQKVTSPVGNNEDLWVVIKIRTKKYDSSFEIGYNVVSEDGQVLFWSFFYDQQEVGKDHFDGDTTILRSKLPRRLLNNGYYTFGLVAGIRSLRWFINPTKHRVSINLKIEGNLSESLLWNKKRSGPIAPILEWEVKSTSSEMKTISQNQRPGNTA